MCMYESNELQHSSKDLKSLGFACKQMYKCQMISATMLLNNNNEEENEEKSNKSDQRVFQSYSCSY